MGSWQVYLLRKDIEKLENIYNITGGNELGG